MRGVNRGWDSIYGRGRSPPRDQWGERGRQGSSSSRSPPSRGDGRHRRRRSSRSPSPRGGHGSGGGSQYWRESRSRSRSPSPRRGSKSSHSNSGQVAPPPPPVQYGTPQQQNVHRYGQYGQHNGLQGPSPSAGFNTNQQAWSYQDVRGGRGWRDQGVYGGKRIGGYSHAQYGSQQPPPPPPLSSSGSSNSFHPPPPPPPSSSPSLGSYGGGGGGGGGGTSLGQVDSTDSLASLSKRVDDVFQSMDLEGGPSVDVDFMSNLDLSTQWGEDDDVASSPRGSSGAWASHNEHTDSARMGIHSTRQPSEGVQLSLSSLTAKSTPHGWARSTSSSSSASSSSASFPSSSSMGQRVNETQNTGKESRSMMDLVLELEPKEPKEWDSTLDLVHTHLRDKEQDPKPRVLRTRYNVRMQGYAFVSPYATRMSWVLRNHREFGSRQPPVREALKNTPVYRVGGACPEEEKTLVPGDPRLNDAFAVKPQAKSKMLSFRAHTHTDAWTMNDHTPARVFFTSVDPSEVASLDRGLTKTYGTVEFVGIMPSISVAQARGVYCVAQVRFKDMSAAMQCAAEHQDREPHMHVVMDPEGVQYRSFVRRGVYEPIVRQPPTPPPQPSRPSAFSAQFGSNIRGGTQQDDDDVDIQPISELALEVYDDEQGSNARLVDAFNPNNTRLQDEEAARKKEMEEEEKAKRTDAAHGSGAPPSTILSKEMVAAKARAKRLILRRESVRHVEKALVRAVMDELEHRAVDPVLVAKLKELRGRAQKLEQAKEEEAKRKLAERSAALDEELRRRNEAEEERRQKRLREERERAERKRKQAEQLQAAQLAMFEMEANNSGGTVKDLAAERSARKRKSMSSKEDGMGTDTHGNGSGDGDGDMDDEEDELEWDEEANKLEDDEEAQALAELMAEDEEQAELGMDVEVEAEASAAAAGVASEQPSKAGGHKRKRARVQGSKIGSGESLVQSDEPERGEKLVEVPFAHMVQFYEASAEVEDRVYSREALENMRAHLGHDVMEELGSAQVVWSAKNVEMLRERLLEMSKTQQRAARLLGKEHVAEGQIVRLEQNKSGCVRSEPARKVPLYIKASYLEFEKPKLKHVMVEQSDTTKKQESKGGSRDARSRARRLGMEMEASWMQSEAAKVSALAGRNKKLMFAKSGIHGYGLFSMQKIAAKDMVVEYVGEVVRSDVADRREKRYESEGMGSSYLFRISRDKIVDATKKGGLGRFMNHSCDPNCYAQVVDVNGEPRILVYALRDIGVGEEITYDYKFPLEDEKIPCFCGSEKCRGFLN